jgi:hypothetical protein
MRLEERELLNYAAEVSGGPSAEIAEFRKSWQRGMINLMVDADGYCFTPESGGMMRAGQLDVAILVF